MEGTYICWISQKERKIGFPMTYESQCAFDEHLEQRGERYPNGVKDGSWTYEQSMIREERIGRGREHKSKNEKTCDEKIGSYLRYNAWKMRIYPIRLDGIFVVV